MKKGLKAMSGTIDYYTRVKIARRLAACVGRRTADYKSLAKVATRVTSKIGIIREDRDLKKAVVLITDGGSDDDGLPCRDVSCLVPTMEKLLEELPEDL
jgi:hypothetical protein